MAKFTARIVSILLSPSILLLPTPYVLVYKTTNDVLFSLKWTAFSYIFLIAMILSVMIGTFTGIFSDFDVTKKEERPKLFILGFIISFLYFTFLLILHGPKVLLIFISAVLLGVILISLIIRWIKISIHTAAVSAFTLSIVILFGLGFFPALLLIPLMGWSRLKTKKHTLLEVVLGGLFGLSLTIIVYVFSKLFIL